MHIQKTLFIMKFLTKSIYFISDHHQILSRKRFCSSSRQNIGQYIRHIVAGCSYQHTSFPIVQNSKGYFEKKKWDKICKIKKKNKIAEIQDGRYSSGLYKKKCCAPSTYTTQRKHQTKGVSICPHTFGCPHMFGCPCIFGCSLCLNAPVCLDSPNVWMPPYIWMMFGCPLYIHNTNKGYFVRQRRCPHAPIHLDAPCT